ncbi:KAP-like P-loop domain-containing protein [Entomoplasma freundtii]|uniref:KAP NTPase domain-containing protein n=1 Tax=Entomoplasma freundtii TaxID=74700 RepID=A0A2K8NU69_9MOLU|nr:P-loop NTPase fold protein [Entomoplasma freundtii]ATZ16311.1 hypothetical protein EFREU_v1c02850 [Entomoplasma freundtii]TDY56787.1 KAP-like P-loop domain-containing protein [Entomoplasma freundtii]
MKYSKLTQLFSSDIIGYFNRAKEVEFFILPNYKNNVAINGCWGSGKTVFLENVEKTVSKKCLELQNKKTITLLIKLWKYEVIDNNFFLVVVKDIIQNILDQVVEVDKKQKGKIKKWTKKLVDEMEKLSWSLNFGFSCANLTLSKGVKNILNINDNFSFFKGITSLINYLRKLFKNFSEYNFLIGFDDLDRCSEENILKLLTVLKIIFFEIKEQNVFFVTTINSKQIDCLNKSTESYIQKIFDYIFDLENEIEYSSQIGKRNPYESNLINHFKYKNYRFVDNLNFKEISSETSTSKPEILANNFYCLYKELLNNTKVILKMNEVERIQKWLEDKKNFIYSQNNFNSFINSQAFEDIWTSLKNKIIKPFYFCFIKKDKYIYLPWSILFFVNLNSLEEHLEKLSYLYPFNPDEYPEFKDKIKGNYFTIPIILDYFEQLNSTIFLDTSTQIFIDNLIDIFDDCNIYNQKNHASYTHLAWTWTEEIFEDLIKHNQS